jgi:hypothetical protein
MKIELGKDGTGFNSVVASCFDFNDGTHRVISDISDDGIICKPDAVNTGSIINSGITLTVDSDDLAYELANIVGDTDGKYSLAKLLKTMIRKYSDCMDEDDLFKSAAVLVKECERRISTDMRVEKNVLKAATATLENVEMW